MDGSKYSFDSDEGDISLSLTTASSMPTISSLSSFRNRESEEWPKSGSTSSTPIPAPVSAPGAGQVPVTAPKGEERLFGKALWARTTSGSTTPILAPEINLNETNQRNGSTSYSLPPPPPGLADERSNLGIGSSSTQTTPTKHRPTPLPRRTSSSTSTHSLNRSRSMGNRLSAAAAVSPNPSALSPGDSPSRNGARTPSMRLGWSRRPGEPRPPPMVEMGVRRRMERWVKEIVVCNFDLERGPVIERRAVGRRWGPGEKENVAFSSFPDTSLFAEGSILFSFKIRHTPPDPTTESYPEPPSPMPDRHMIDPIPTVEQALLNLSVQEGGASESGSGSNGLLSPPPSSTSFTSLASDGSTSTMSVSQSLPVMSDGEKSVEYRKWDERGREWLYGFVWFEQRKDRGIARGYMQKSLVILTHLPFPSLFFSVLSHLAPVFFEHGYSALEAGCHSISNWPDPQPGLTMELPILSDLITVKLPDGETPQMGRGGGIPMPGASGPESPILASLPPSTPLRAFASCLPALWSLWECLVLAEPILVIAPDPKTCSEIVWWLRDLLRPIPPAGDFRPYLHIHDHDFSLLVNSNKPQPGTVVGVTNPFFRNAAAHWPNVISIPGDKPKRIMSTASPKLDAEGFISRRQRGISKDRALLKRLEGLIAEGKLDDPGGNEALRLHFQQLTERFLVPLNRYFQTLVPSSSPSSMGPVQIKPWSIPNFLAHLKNHGPNPLQFKTKGLTTKSRVEHDFYASFCMSATFAGWLSGRIESQGLGMGARHQEVGMRLEIPPTIRNRIRETSSASNGLGIAGYEELHPALAKEDSRVGVEDFTRQSSEDGSSYTSHGHDGLWRASEESPRGLRVDMYGRRASEGAVKALRGMR